MSANERSGAAGENDYVAAHFGEVFVGICRGVGDGEELDERWSGFIEFTVHEVAKIDEEVCISNC